MTIVRDDSVEREARVDRMFNEFREAKSRREAKLSNSVAAAEPDGNPRAARHVPDKYLSLYAYLEHRRSSAIIVLTFDQVEAVLGFPLPPSARTQPGWWGASAVPCLCHSSAWTETGRTAAPSLRARTVRFERRLERR